MENVLFAVLGFALGWWLSRFLTWRIQTLQRATRAIRLVEQADHKAREYRRLNSNRTRVVDPCAVQCLFACSAEDTRLRCRDVCRYTLETPGYIPILTDEVKETR